MISIEIFIWSRLHSQLFLGLGHKLDHRNPTRWLLSVMQRLEWIINFLQRSIYVDKFIAKLHARTIFFSSLETNFLLVVINFGCWSNREGILWIASETTRERPADFTVGNHMRQARFSIFIRQNMHIHLSTDIPDRLDRFLTLSTFFFFSGMTQKFSDVSKKKIRIFEKKRN